MSRFRVYILMISLVFLTVSSAFATYTDEVEMSVDEFWKASLQVMQTYGKFKQNESKHTIETHWIEDRVRRSQGLTKEILKQGYQRRYKIKISMQQKGPVCEATVKGLFNIRTDSGPMIPWKKIKPKGTERQIEREIYFKILSQAALNRSQPSAENSASN